jgi:5'-nucleotidase
MPFMTRVLLTNDDGCDAAGLLAARRSLLDAGFGVTTIAPDGDRSGSARRISCEGPVAVERVGGSDDAPIYACTGTPVDCVRIGVMAAPFRAHDLVISGINHGVNLGDDASYSGTVGAALEAALLGVPALALSQQDRGRGLSALGSDGHDFAAASLVPELAAAALVRPPRRIALNVNLPHRLLEHEAVVTRLGTPSNGYRRIQPAAMTERGWRFHAYLGGAEIDVSPGTDAAALASGRISLTPLSADWNGDADARRADAWAGRIAAAATRALRVSCSAG